MYFQNFIKKLLSNADPPQRAVLENKCNTK